jgi:hypothetical protein
LPSIQIFVEVPKSTELLLCFDAPNRGSRDMIDYAIADVDGSVGKRVPPSATIPKRALSKPNELISALPTKRVWKVQQRL